MTYYAYLLIVLHVLMFGFHTGKERTEEVGRIVISFALYLPIIGRVIGWW